MMKKFAFLMLAIVAMLASCSQEDTLQTKAEDTLQAVTITAALPEVVPAPAATRAITATDDDDATRCLMQIVEEGVTKEVQEGTISNGSCSFTVTLNPTKEYKLMFWADNEKYTADAAQGLEKLTANASPVGIAYAGTATWGGSKLDAAINVDLKHVVGKLTLRTTTAVSAGKQYSLKIPATYTAYDVLAGELLEASPDGTTYSYTVPTGGVAAEGDLFSIYLLAGSETQNLTLTNDGADFPIANVPLAPNKHTILKGDVQNAGFREVTFTATVVEQWDGEETKYIIPGDAVEITAENCSDINGDGNYVVSGTFNNQITVIGGSPTIYLENANINITSDNHAINITGGNPTIYILGNNNISVNENNYGAGIYVAEGNSVTITGTSVDDVLVVTGGSGCCGIGGYLSDDDYTYVSHPCGDITIENITVKATSNIPQATGGYAAAIGATGDKAVGSIKISNAVVYAHDGGTAHYGGAAIGGGTDGRTGQTSFDITISDSEIHVSKGCPYASYIGSGGAVNTMQMNYKIIPSAKITNSIIYDESGMEITQ